MLRRNAAAAPRKTTQVKDRLASSTAHVAEVWVTYRLTTPNETLAITTKRAIAASVSSQLRRAWPTRRSGRVIGGSKRSHGGLPTGATRRKRRQLSRMPRTVSRRPGVHSGNSS